MLPQVATDTILEMRLLFFTEKPSGSTSFRSLGDC